MADLFQTEAYWTLEYYDFFVDHIPDTQRDTVLILLPKVLKMHERFHNTVSRI
jgi:hypothetical protein